MSNGAEKNGVEGAKLFKPILRHHAAGAEIVLASPLEFFEGQADAVAQSLCRRLQDFNGGRNHFLTDPVTGNKGDMVMLVGHGELLYATTMVGLK
jgi:hypothetical protein